MTQNNDMEIDSPSYQYYEFEIASADINAMLRDATKNLQIPVTILSADLFEDELYHLVLYLDNITTQGIEIVIKENDPIGRIIIPPYSSHQEIEYAYQLIKSATFQSYNDNPEKANIIAENLKISFDETAEECFHNYLKALENKGKVTRLESFIQDYQISFLFLEQKFHKSKAEDLVNLAIKDYQKLTNLVVNNKDLEFESKIFEKYGEEYVQSYIKNKDSWGLVGDYCLIYDQDDEYERIKRVDFYTFTEQINDNPYMDWVEHQYVHICKMPSNEWTKFFNNIEGQIISVMPIDLDGLLTDGI